LSDVSPLCFAFQIGFFIEENNFLVFCFENKTSRMSDYFRLKIFRIPFRNIYEKLTLGIVSVDVGIISEVSDDVGGEFDKSSDVANDELSSSVVVTDPSSVVKVFDSIVSFPDAEVVSSVLFDNSFSGVVGGPVLVTIEAVSPREVHNKPSFVLEVLSESEKVVDDAVLSILDGSLLSVESSVPLTVVDSGFVDISVVLLGSKLIVVSKSIVPFYIKNNKSINKNFSFKKNSVIIILFYINT
jgi:hypothetical protein